MVSAIQQLVFVKAIDVKAVDSPPVWPNRRAIAIKSLFEVRRYPAPPSKKPRVFRCKQQ
jgi:hypothetical protein